MGWEGDETTIEAYDGQKKSFSDGSNHFIAQKGKGASHMYAGCVGGFVAFLTLTKGGADAWLCTWGQMLINMQRAKDGFTLDSVPIIYHLITTLDDQGLPKLIAGKAHRASFLRGLEIGKNKGGYWDSLLQAQCSGGVCMIRDIKYPWVLHFEK